MDAEARLAELRAAAAAVKARQATLLAPSGSKGIGVTIQDLEEAGFVTLDRKRVHVMCAGVGLSDWQWRELRDWFMTRGGTYMVERSEAEDERTLYSVSLWEEDQNTPLRGSRLYVQYHFGSGEWRGYWGGTVFGLHKVADIDRMKEVTRGGETY